MVLIYSHISSSRLQYICSVIFKELIGIEFAITIDSEEFKNHTGAKINYSHAEISPDEFRIQNHSLLFENNIRAQAIKCFDVNNYKGFFKSVNSHFAFDIFAASFYLISRYEEYLPREKDMYGRYDYQNSLAFKEGFLNMPLVNIWVKGLAEKLKEKYPIFNTRFSNFKFEPTYDVDIAYSYKHKGILRNIGGFILSPSAKRIQVLAGLKKDPFDNYEWLDVLHQQYNLKPLYFFLVAEKNGTLDKNILPHKEAMWTLVKHHSEKYSIGLHPSWQSGDDLFLLKKEKKQLEAMSENSQAIPASQAGCSKSRQHYIRFNLPEGYNRLTASGITDDYSMGYGSINGFRASVASSFYWYNLETEKQAPLRIHPFCFMDANAYYEQKQTVKQTFDELMHYLSVCKQVNGTLITIWHNNFLGDTREFKGWKEMYGQFIAQVQQ